MNIFKYIILLGAFSFLSASNPIGQVYFAKKFLSQYPKNEKEFYIGTLFPDIKLLDPSLETHFENILITDVLQEKSPFAAGMKFHSFLEDARNEFMDQYGALDLLQEYDVAEKSAFLQIVENEVLFHTAYYGATAGYFFKVTQEELQWESDEEVIQKWHSILINSLADSPQYFVARMRYNPEGLLTYSQEELKRWHKALPTALKDPRIVEYVDQYRAFMEKKLLEKSH